MALVNRWYSILNILYLTPKIQLATLARLLNVSKVTVRNNIRLLNNELGETAKIIFDNGYYVLNIIDSKRFNEILSGEFRFKSDFNSVSKRQAFILKTLLESQSTVKISELSLDLNVSRGTVENDLISIREDLKKYSLNLVGVPNKGLKIVGSDSECALIYCNEIMNYFELEILSPIFVEKLDKIYEDMGISYEIRDLSLRAIKTIIIFRENDRLISNSIEFFHNYIDKHETIFKKFIYEIENEFNIKLNQFEIEFLSFPLNVYNQGDYLNKFYVSSLVNILFKKMIESSFELFAIEIDQEEIYKKINVHLHYLINRMATKTVPKDIFLEDLSEKYPLCYELAKASAKSIESYLGLSMSESEINYLVIYFEMFLRDRSFNKKYKVGLVCHTGRGTARLIESNLLKVLGDQVETVMLATHQIDNDNLNKLSAIFTTVPLQIMNSNVPVIQINKLFDSHQVSKEWDKVKHMHIKSVKTIEFDLQLLEGQGNYSSYIEKMSKQLINMGYVDGEFTSKILAREDIKTTLFDSGIAMPHAVQTKTNKIVFSLGVFKNMSIDEKDFKLIFMVGIPEESDLEIENALLSIYDFIFKVSRSMTLKEELLALRSKKGLKELILRV